MTADTKYFINREAVSVMKPGAYLINPARGLDVDEPAVAAALESGHLSGYAADVFAMEDWVQPDRPQTISPALLANIDRTVLTPHLGSAVDDVRREIALQAARSMVQAIYGEVPQGAVNRSADQRVQQTDSSAFSS